MIEGKTIEQKDARILREALAKIAALRVPQISPIADNALKRYAAAIAPYCEHVETVTILAEQKRACLDCGARMALLEVVK